MKIKKEEDEEDEGEGDGVIVGGGIEMRDEKR
jgi:hypothetical protein